MDTFETGILQWQPQPTTVAKDEFQPLVSRCLQGDQAAYALLYRACASMIYRLNISLLGDVEDAEEVLQDSFEYAFRKLHQYDPNKAAFKTWLYRIAISRCHNKRRRKWLPTIPLQHYVRGEVEIADQTSKTPQEMLNLSEEQQRVWAALMQLSDKLRVVAVLRYYDDLRYREIGEILHISAKTVESRMRLAHKQLRFLLAEKITSPDSN